MQQQMTGVIELGDKQQQEHRQHPLDSVAVHAHRAHQRRMPAVAEADFVLHALARNLAREKQQQQRTQPGI